MKLSSCGLFIAALLALANACGGDDDDTPANAGSAGSGLSGPGTGGAGQQPGPASDCSGRCTTKASACGLPSNLLGPYCGQLCGAAPTESELRCLEGKSCQELNGAGQDPLSLCRSGNQGQAGQGQAGQGQAGSPNPGSRAALGEVCDCGGAITCLDTANGPCEGELTCLDFLGSDNSSSDPDFLGACTQRCQPDGNGGRGDCPNGFTCVERYLNTTSFGTWCSNR